MLTRSGASAQGSSLPCNRAGGTTNGHWNVRVRTHVIVCSACGANTPKWQNPQFCPECGAGKDAAGAAGGEGNPRPSYDELIGLDTAMDRGGY